jgi:SSS family solute:Na+ symporter
LATTYLALNTVSGGEGMLAGFSKVVDAAPEKFHMILDEFNANGSTKANYLNLPGIWVLIGGLWVANIYYWGFNKYIIQRTLVAKSLKESQKGILLAAGLKIIIPLIVVVPGIAAYVMVNDPTVMARLGEAGQLSLPSASQADKACGFC